jgi:hypothetical protein
MGLGPPLSHTQPHDHTDCVHGGNETYMYAYHGGMVKVTPRMMPNTDGWIKEANWIGDMRIGFKGLVATHMCSYWCW